MILDAKPVSSQDDLMKQLKIFLSGASGSTRQPVKPQLCSTALHLLTHLPAAREAVFEYFGYVLDGIVARHQPVRDNQENKQSYNEDEEEVLQQLSQTLTDLVTSSSAWAGLVSSWSLDTLGKLSSKWSNKICGKDASLSGQLSSWLSVSVGRVMLDLSSDSLSRLMNDSSLGHDTDQTVATLLETSVKHAPYFDWVIAHIGSCFPASVTSRVLSCGLRDFISNSGDGVSGDIVLSRTPRLNCVVNILTHLTSTHIADVQSAVHQLLVSSVTGPRSQVNTATVPFLLSLASISSGVRRAVTSDLAPLITQHMDKIPAMLREWNEKYFTSNNSLLTAVSQLLMATDRGGPELLLLLLQTGGVDDDVGGGARLLLNTVLADLFSQVHNVSKNRVDDISLFSGMSGVMSSVQKTLLSPHAATVSSCSTLLYLYCLHKGRSAGAGLVRWLLSQSHDQIFSTLVMMVEQLEQFHVTLVRDAVTMALRDVNTDKLTVLTNLIKLCETGDNSWSRAVVSCQEQLGQLMSRSELTDSCLRLFLLVPPDTKMRVRSVFRLSRAVVTVLTDSLTSVLETEDKIQRVSTCETILTQLCSIKCGLQITLRFLLDSSINTQFCSQLGGTLISDTSVRHKTTVSLLQENYKHGTKPVQPLGATVTYHAGVIGSGVRGETGTQEVSAEQQQVNMRLVSGVIHRLCEVRGNEGCKQLALLMVEMISPDIMYNGKIQKSLSLIFIIVMFYRVTLA